MPSQKQLRRQALLLSRIRYGPEIGALTQLLGDARSTRDTAVNNARGGADALVGSLQGLRPQLTSIYDHAESRRNEAGAEADQAMAGVSGVIADSIRNARAREAAQADTRASEAETAAQTEVGQRTVDARAGAIRGAQQAERAYRDDAGKIGDRMLGLTREQGAFIETTLGDLTEQQRKRVIDEANLDINRQRADIDADKLTHDINQDAYTRRKDRRSQGEAERHNRAMERNGRRKGGSGGSAGATPETIRNAHRDVRKAFSLARNAKKDGKALKPGQGREFVDEFLVGEKGMDPIIAEAGTSYYLYGRITPKLRQELQREYGVGGVKALRRR